MPAVFDKHYVKRLDGPNVKKGRNKKDLAEQVVADIRKSSRTTTRSDGHGLGGSTEIFATERPRINIRASCALEQNDPTIPSSTVYATYA